MKSARKITVPALSAACAALLLWASSVLPTGQLGFAAAASLFVAAASLEIGIGGGLACYVVAAVLGFLLAADKAAVLLFALFFGYYPAIKLAAEKWKNRVLCWAAKLAVMNAAFSAFLFALDFTFFKIPTEGIWIPVLYAAGNAVFLLFDYGLTKLMRLYLYRRPHSSR